MGRKRGRQEKTKQRPLSTLHTSMNVLVDMGGISVSSTWRTSFSRVACFATLLVTGPCLPWVAAPEVGVTPCTGWGSSAEAVMEHDGSAESVRGEHEVVGSSPSAPVEEPGRVFSGPGGGRSDRRLKPRCSGSIAVVMGSTPSAGQACNNSFILFFVYFLFRV
jgi:hypothetical protein